MLPGRPLSMAMLAILLCVLAAPLSSPSHEAGELGGEVCINEFLPWPVDGSKYIELYNPGEEAVDLSGWVLSLGDNRSTHDLSGVLPGGGYMLLPESHTSLSPRSRGDTLWLYTPAGIAADSFSYNYSDQYVPFARLPDGEDWYSPVAQTPGETNGPPPQSTEGLVISSFLPRISSKWEFVSLNNPHPMEVDLNGWRLSNMRGTWLLGAYQLEVGSDAVVARDMECYTMMMGDAANMTPVAGTMTLGDGGDALLLKDPWGRVVDAVWYGDVEPQSPWTGLPAILPGYGEVAHRRGFTNSSVDWPQLFFSKAGTTGFQGGTHAVHKSTAFASPDGGYEPIISFIENASESILVNVYQLTHPLMAESLVSACERGVDVRLLLDGNPVGWNWGSDEGSQSAEALQELHLLTKIVDAGGEARFVADDGSTPRGKRYRFNHAKYAVADPGEHGRVIISTENWKQSGFPQAGQEGNRGWNIIMDSESMSLSLLEVFESDWLGLGDMEPLGSDRYPFVWEHDIYASEPVGRIVQHPPLLLEEGFQARLVVGPEENLHDDLTLGMIADAERTICAELLSLSVEWNIDGGINNPYVDALIDAARRGVNVRILLDQTYVNMSDGYDNYDAMLWLLDRAEGLPLEVRMADSRGMGVEKVHAKGMVVDGKAVLISSMNWNANSALRNREIGVIMYSTEAAEYYEAVFMWDWEGGGDVRVSAEEGGAGNWSVWMAFSAVAACLAAVYIWRLRARGGSSEQW